MTARCHFCGQPAADGEDPRNALCEAHRAIHQHVVSVQTGKPEAKFAAVCKCGWGFASDSVIRREEAIEAHWTQAVGEQAK